jgi:curved DNA-binding protein CbpA
MHPDHGGNERDFQLLNDAYCTLSDPYSRAAYDSRLGFYAHEQQAAARAASQAASWAASQTTSRAASQMRRETEEVAARRKAAATKEKPFPVHLFRMILFIIFVIYVVRECS